MKYKKYAWKIFRQSSFDWVATFFDNRFENWLPILTFDKNIYEFSDLYFIDLPVFGEFKFFQNKFSVFLKDFISNFNLTKVCFSHNSRIVEGWFLVFQVLWIELDYLRRHGARELTAFHKVKNNHDFIQVVYNSEFSILNPIPTICSARQLILFLI